eukprot:103389-Amphidinium_carterae.1
MQSSVCYPWFLEDDCSTPGSKRRARAISSEKRSQPKKRANASRVTWSAVYRATCVRVLECCSARGDSGVQAPLTRVIWYAWGFVALNYERELHPGASIMPAYRFPEPSLPCAHWALGLFASIKSPACALQTL